MDLIVSFLIGVIVGGGIGFLVYRNNKKRLEELEKTLKG